MQSRVHPVTSSVRQEIVSMVMVSVTACSTVPMPQTKLNVVSDIGNQYRDLIETDFF